MKCPCHSQKLYRDCCQPYHQGALPPKAVDLMRSRYAAYALSLGDYIMHTTHPKSPHFIPNQKLWLENITLFAKGTEFINLKILDQINGEHESFVTFTAFLKQQGRDASFTEKSRFKKENGRWLYLDGEHQPSRRS